MVLLPDGTVVDKLAATTVEAFEGSNTAGLPTLLMTSIGGTATGWDWGGWLAIIGCTLAAAGPCPEATRDPSDSELWDISVPCTALISGMRGEVERAKTVEVTEGRGERREAGRAEGNAEVVRREERVVGTADGRAEVVVEGMRC